MQKTRWIFQLPSTPFLHKSKIRRSNNSRKLLVQRCTIETERDRYKNTFVPATNSYGRPRSESRERLTAEKFTHWTESELERIPMAIMRAIRGEPHRSRVGPASSK